MDCQSDIVFSAKTASRPANSAHASPSALRCPVFWWLLGTLGFSFTEVLLNVARLQSLRQLLNSSLYIPCWSCLLLFFGCLPKVIPTRLLNLSLLSLLLSPFAVWGAGSQIIYLQAMRLIWYLTLFLQYLHFSSFLAYYGTGRVFSANLQRKSLQIRFFMLYLVIAPFLGDIAAGLCYDLKEARNFWWLLPDVLNMTSVSPLISWIMAYFFAVFCCYLAWVLLKGLPEAAEPSNYGGAAPSARHDNPPAT